MVTIQLSPHSCGDLPPTNHLKACPAPPRTATMQENWDDEIIDRMAVADPFRIPIGTGSIPPSYQSVHNLHTRAFQCLQQNNLSQAFQYEHEALQQLLTVFHTDKTGRHVPILLVVARNTRDLGFQTGQLLIAEATIKKGFVECIASKNKQKKWGSVEMANQLMWIYFRLTKLSMCAPLFTQVDRATSKMGTMGMDQVPMAHRVTSQYYRGRLALFNLDPVVAEEALDFSLQHCATTSPHNKRLILHSLIPAKLLHGKYPTTSLLEKYKCHQYIELVQAVKNGDVGMFEQSVTRHQVFFIKKGLFMLIPWIRILLHRNLFYRISLLNKEMNEQTKKHILDLTKCEGVMTSLSNGKKVYDTNMVQCILAGLIDRGFIKGYIAHGSNKMVLKKTNAFLPVKASMFKKE